MSPSAVPSSSSHLQAGKVFSVPGKAFILGEYAVLSGQPALLATFAPRFRMTQVAAEKGDEFHPRSPVGRLLAHAREGGWVQQETGFKFEDPFHGEGGFGASTAQFALIYGALASRASWELSALGARRLYRQLMGDESVVPSGADLVAQWSGGVTCFEPRSDQIGRRFGELDWRNLLIFSAAGLPGRKVRTHEHLAGLASEKVRVQECAEILGKIIHRALNRLEAANVGNCINEYAEALAQAGLELPAAAADREALRGLPGLLGIKGTGALLADGLVALVEDGAAPRAALIEAARARGLRLVADGLGTEPQKGFECAR